MFFGEPDKPWLSLFKHLHQSCLTAKFADHFQEILLISKRWGENHVGCCESFWHNDQFHFVKHYFFFEMMKVGPLVFPLCAGEVEPTASHTESRRSVS